MGSPGFMSVLFNWKVCALAPAGAKQSKIAQRVAATQALIRDMFTLWRTWRDFHNSELFFAITIK
jgi:hypothetical protein